jgi:hypothetical protein
MMFVFKNFVLQCHRETICVDLKIILQPEDILYNSFLNIKKDE